MMFSSGLALLLPVAYSEVACQFSANTKVNVPFHMWHAVHASSKEDCCQKCADDSVCVFSTFHSRVNSCRLKSGAAEKTYTEADTYTCQPGASTNIVGVAESVGGLSTLVSAVVAADLVDTLSSVGPFTVFAPLNDAFSALGSDTIDSLMKPENKATLVDILTYHVVSGQAYSGDLRDGMEIATVQGGTVKVSIGSGTLKINNAKVVLPDVLASNGVAHVIDAVLLQPEQPKLNIVELAESVDDLSTLVAAVVAADLADTLSSGSFTVFAPTNEAFSALGSDTLDSLMNPANKATLVDILTYHVLPSTVLAGDLRSFQRVKTVEGKNLHIYKDSKRGVRVTPNGRDFNSVTSADNLATNGVVHIIDGVLSVPSHVVV